MNDFCPNSGRAETSSIKKTLIKLYVHSYFCRRHNPRQCYSPNLRSRYRPFAGLSVSHDVKQEDDALHRLATKQRSRFMSNEIQSKPFKFIELDLDKKNNILKFR